MRTLATLNIVENDDYQTALSRDWEGAQQALALYGVVLTTPWGTETYHVIAESEEGATDQARCAAQLESYRVTPETEALISATARRLPLIIRGWSRNRF